MIFHAEKRSGFVMLDKAPLNDRALSMKAKGLLAYLLSKPPDWRPQVADICAHCNDGPRAIRAALRELERAGYATLVKERDSLGASGSQWIINEKSSKIEETPMIPEIAVLRNSRFGSPNKNKNTNKKDPRGRSCEELKNYPDRKMVADMGLTVEHIREEAIENTKRLLGISETSPFWKEWKDRIQSAPFRTSVAFTYLQDELCDPFPKDPIKNPGGRANWYFLNLDVDSPSGQLIRGCRGKRVAE
jgi:hypothetical protein